MVSLLYNTNVVQSYEIDIHMKMVVILCFCFLLSDMSSLYKHIVALFYYLSLSSAHYFTIEHINSQLDAPIFFFIVKSSAIQGDG